MKTLFLFLILIFLNNSISAFYIQKSYSSITNVYFANSDEEFDDEEGSEEEQENEEIEENA